jgi:predicted alpha/beta-fold hydrolase
VSLGGNVLLKYLGERSERGRDVVRAAVAISVPFDLAASAAFVERGFSRVYRWFLVRRLKRKVRAKAAVLGGHIDVRRALNARTFSQFDDASTAPLHGFRDAADYYQRSSSAGYLAGIRVPTLLVHSRDDPFLPADAIPEEAVGENTAIEFILTDKGGHVGFVEGTPLRPRFWAERAAADFIAEWLQDS